MREHPSAARCGRWTTSTTPLTYSLEVSGVGSDPPFVIDPATAQIQVVQGATLDSEDQPVYQVTVTARDPFAATGTARFAINVTDVNEAPTPSPTTSRWMRTATLTIEITDLIDNDTDPEGDTLSVIRYANAGDGTLTRDADTITYEPRDNFHAVTGSCTRSPTANTAPPPRSP